MKNTAYIIAAIALAIVLTGCGISAGPWAGQMETIIERPDLDSIPAPVTQTPDTTPTVKLTYPNPNPVIEIQSETIAPQSSPVPTKTFTVEPTPKKPAVVEKPVAPTVEPVERINPKQRIALREIDRIGRLNSLWEKRLAYREIAESRGISTQTQIHLIEAVFDNLISDTAKEEILITLIFNPDFDPQAKSVIVDKLHNFKEQSTKTRIASVLPKVTESDTFSAQK